MHALFPKKGELLSLPSISSGHSNVSSEIACTPSTARNMTLFCSYCVVGATVFGCTWYLTRLARGPHGEPLFATHHHLPDSFSELPRRIVVWTKSNPTPWNEVKQDENVKMMSVNQKFEKRYVYVPLLHVH